MDQLPHILSEGAECGYSEEARKLPDFDGEEGRSEEFISHSTLEYLIIFRLVPGLPLMVQNIILSLLDIPKFKFLLATFLGFTPIFFTSVIIGNRIKNIQLIKGITGKDLFTWDIVLIISVLILFLILKIKFKKNN